MARVRFSGDAFDFDFLFCRSFIVLEEFANVSEKN